MMNKILPEGSRRRRLVERLFFEPKVPAHIARNFITLPDSDLEIIKASLVQNFFSREPNDHLSTDVGKKGLLDHLTVRLERDRKLAIPWLDSARRLKGAKVLEIGCGTGASTVALAEQGAEVTAIDIDEKALLDAKTRCEVYGLSVDFHLMNSTEVARVFSKGAFDFIIFWACLEHMTHEERMIAMKDTWDMLPPGGLWCVADTPNRLYCYDAHTSLLPFFFWLPDDLAIKYARFSPRRIYKDSFLQYNGENEHLLEFLRWGRGLSYHEFELTMKPLDQLNIVSCMSIYHRRRGIFSFLRSKVSSAHRYESFFHKLFPAVHRGFLGPSLDLIIQKD